MESEREEIPTERLPSLQSQDEKAELWPASQWDHFEQTVGQ